MICATSGSLARLVSTPGKTTASAASRSAARRALRAQSSSRPLEMIARFAWVTVGSRRATMSPPLTRSPSRTRSSPTTPPVGCCTFLTFESTTTDPDAMSAPESWVVPAQPPTAATRMPKTVSPARMLRRIDRRVGVDLARTLCAPGFRDDLERPRRLLAMQHLGEDFVFRAERHRSTFLHGQEEIDPGDGARAVGNHDCDAAAGADAENRLRQGGVAFGIEIGVRLVQNHQERVAIERAGKRNALGLPGRQSGAPLADLGIVAALQGNDHVVNAGGRRRRAYRFWVRIGLETADVLRHAPAEKLHMLRQVADIAAEHVRRPLIQCGAVEGNLALN